MSKRCCVEGCARKHYAHGYCNTHWARIRRNGSLHRKKAGNGEPAKWIRDLVESNSTESCIKYPFGIGNHGYGTLSVNGKPELAHRYVCILAHGMPPTTLHQAAHSCGNKTCVNRKHLRWATRHENEADKEIHGTRLRGESHPGRKLTSQQVFEIRSATGSQSEIARKHGVCQQTISDIKSGNRWAWL